MSNGTLVAPTPIVRLNVLAAVPLIKKLFAKSAANEAQAPSKAEPLPMQPMMLLGGNTQSYTPTLHLEARLKKVNDSGQGEIIFSDAFNTTENWRNFTQTIEIAKDKLADCEEGELILKWYSHVQTTTPTVWIDEVRAERSSLEVLTWADYYPYGLVMREGTCDSYRYQYQGETAEKDKETGWNHRAAFRFELREYDPVIGRWLSIDPYGEFWSPYVGMGNDPVNNIDPDGGETDPPTTQRSNSKPEPKMTIDDMYMDGGKRYFGAPKIGFDIWQHQGLGMQLPQIKVDMPTIIGNVFGVGGETWSKNSDRIGGVSLGVGASEYRLGKVLEKRFLNFGKQMPKYSGFRASPYLTKFQPPFRLKTIFIQTRFVSKVASILKTSGSRLGVLGLGITAIEIGTGQKNVIGEGLLDLLMGAAGFIPVYGWAISGTYFLGKFILQQTGNDFWNKPKQ